MANWLKILPNISHCSFLVWKYGSTWDTYMFFWKKPSLCSERHFDLLKFRKKSWSSWCSLKRQVPAPLWEFRPLAHIYSHLKRHMLQDTNISSTTRKELNWCFSFSHEKRDVLISLEGSGKESTTFGKKRNKNLIFNTPLLLKHATHPF